MDTPLPYKSVVLFIACGAMVFAIVFVFVKRQITRFALKSNRVPHAAIGANVPKSLRHEIEKRLKRVEEIKFEPQLLSDTTSASPELEKCHAYFRMKAVDAVKQFDVELALLYTTVKRKHGDSLRRFLLEQQLDDTGCLHGINVEIIDRFSQMYEHARHDPAPFQKEQYQEYLDLLNKLIEYMKLKYEHDYADGKIMEPAKKNMDTSGEDKHSERCQADEKAKLLAGATTVAIVSGATATDGDDDMCQDDLQENDASSSTVTVKESHVICRPRKIKGSDSGTFLLTSRNSGSSQGSTVETEATFRLTGMLREDGESFV